MLAPCFLPVTHSDIRHVAIALGRTGPNNEYIHAAIFYRRHAGQLSALHFDLGGNILEDDPAREFPRFAWAIPQLSDRILRQMAARCESIAIRPLRFTYQFSFHKRVMLVEKDDSFVIEGGSEGFTCATFILALFQGIRFPLLNLDTWTFREEDEEWQSKTLALLVRYKNRLGISDQALNRRANEIPCLRFSPSDLLGACRVGNHPTMCDPAREAGDQALRWVDAMLAMLNSPR
jgi:hypothetical protein